MIRKCHHCHAEAFESEMFCKIIDRYYVPLQEIYVCRACLDREHLTTGAVGGMEATCMVRPAAMVIKELSPMRKLWAWLNGDSREHRCRYWECPCRAK